MGLGLYFGQIPAVFGEVPLCTVGLSTAFLFAAKVDIITQKIHAHLSEVTESRLGPVCDSLNDVSKELMFIHDACRNGTSTVNIVPAFLCLMSTMKHLGDHAVLVEKDLAALKSDVVELQTNVKELQKVIEVHQQHSDTYQYRDWFSALFDAAGISGSLGKLMRDRRYTKHPLHWNRKAHKDILPQLQAMGISTDVFDVVWRLKENGNFWAHGNRDNFITVENYSEQYTKDAEQLESKQFNGDEKSAIKLTMDVVKKDFDSRASGEDGCGGCAGGVWSGRAHGGGSHGGGVRHGRVRRGMVSGGSGVGVQDGAVPRRGGAGPGRWAPNCLVPQAAS